MPRKPPEIQVEVTWNTSNNPRDMEPWVRATWILLQAKARKEAREQAAHAPTDQAPNDLDHEQEG